MEQTFDWFIAQMYRFYFAVQYHTSFNIYGVTVSFFDIILGGILLSMIISVFWKGARG